VVGAAAGAGLAVALGTAAGASVGDGPGNEAGAEDCSSVWAAVAVGEARRAGAAFPEQAKRSAPIATMTAVNRTPQCSTQMSPVPISARAGRRASEASSERPGAAD